MDRDFGNWLAGFIDGEGCFIVFKARNSWLCRASICLRRDERHILEVIQKETGIGGVYGWKEQVRWSVESKADCRVLVELLEEYPLRAKKAQDFTLWAAAVRAWQRHRRGRGGWPQVARETMEGLKELHRRLIL